MMDKPVFFGKYNYPSKKACISECKRRIKTYKVDQVLQAEDLVFWKELLTLHPKFEPQVGHGIVSMRYGRNDIYSTKCLFATRENGREESVSWMAVFKATKLSDELEAVFEREAARDIEAFTIMALEFGGRCPITNEKLVAGEIHHAYGFNGEGMTFRQLVSSFLANEGINQDDVKLIYPPANKDGVSLPVLASKEFAERWSCYKRKYGSMMLISSEAMRKRHKLTVLS